MIRLKQKIYAHESFYGTYVQKTLGLDLILLLEFNLVLWGLVITTYVTKPLWNPQENDAVALLQYHAGMHLPPH